MAALSHAHRCICRLGYYNIDQMHACVLNDIIMWCMFMQAKYDVKRGKVSRAHQESVIGCRVISITVVLTIIAFVVIPIVTLIVIS